MLQAMSDSSDLRAGAHPDLRTFLAWTGNQLHLTAIHPDSSDIVVRDFGADVDTACEWAAERNRDGYNIHYTVNTVREGVSRKPSKSDIIGVRFAHVDVDPPKDGGAWDLENEFACLANASPPPTMIICSGYGLQGLWRVEQATLSEIEDINRGLVARFDGDNGTHNVDRLLRVPGTINYPNAAKRRRGRKPKLAYIPPGGEDTGIVHGVAGLLAAYVEQGDPFSGVIPCNNFGPLGAIEYNLSFDLGVAPGELLYQLINHPSGEDRSADTFACACEMARQGYSREEIAGVLLCALNPVSAHCLDQKDPERAAIRAIDGALSRHDVARRRAQREANRRIGEGSDNVPLTEIFSQQDMLHRFVFIHDGSQVADLLRPQTARPLADFRNATAGSKHTIHSPNGGSKVVPCSKVWMDHPERKDAQTLTFHAGAGRMTVSPGSNLSALNLWSPPLRDAPPDDWKCRAALFEDHIRWLWGEHADAFLDWLAHIEQQPGELPHFGWIHISHLHGKGRNWISSVLTRVWRGNVAASLDLIGVLNDGFNDRLSRSQLAIVDEINEGGNQSYQHAQALRQIVTAEVREINPKYGRRRIEYNSTRWLLFSNHTGAIPLGEEDRRFFVTHHDGPVRAPEYYDGLYEALKDPLFISSVAEFFRQRDISGFNPGMRPPITKAKADLIDLSRTDDDLSLKELVAKWPVDVITASELTDHLGIGALPRPSVRYAMDRARIRRLRKLRTDRETTQMVYSLRNHDRWATGSPDVLRAEINRETSIRKGEALDEDEDGCGTL